MLGARNLKLQLPMETAGQASQLDISTRSDRTEILRDKLVHQYACVVGSNSMFADKCMRRDDGSRISVMRGKLSRG